MDSFVAQKYITTQRLFIIDQTMKDFHGHHFEYNMALAESARNLGLEPVVAVNRKCEKGLARDFGALPWFQFAWHQSWTGEQSPNHFIDDLFDLLNTRAATSRDIVLIHTVSTPEFDALMQYFLTLIWADAAQLPVFFVLLRRDPVELGADVLADKAKLLDDVFACPGLAAKVVLCTDTEQLAEAWSAALHVPVRVMPIPFRHSFMPPEVTGRAADRPLSIIYLGDARNEKGYQHLPAVVREMWPEWVSTGRVQFTLQSNYNMPGGEPGIASARLRLQHFPSGVTLLTELATPELYYSTLAGADIVVLPYDPQAYARRSSGVMNEALASGKVAVVPRGSWMASQAPEDQLVIYDHPQGLAEAVTDAARRFRRPVGGRPPTRRRIPRAAESGPLRPGHAGLRRPRRSPARPAGAVRDGWATASSCATAPPRWRGSSWARSSPWVFEVHALFLRLDCAEDHPLFTVRRWMDDFRAEIRTLQLASVWAAGYNPLFNRAGYQPEARVLQRRHGGLTPDSDYRSSFAIPPGLLGLLRERPPALALVNYVQNLAFTRQLVGEDVPVVCETHDIQSFQYGLRRREFDEREFDDEMARLRTAAQVIALNPMEAQHLTGQLGAERVAYIAPPPSAVPATPQAMGGAGDLGELIGLCGPSDPDLWPNGRLRKLFEAAPRIDLLYVSSAHEPNLEGLRDFFRQVFHPLLQPQGFTICIAGTICDALRGMEGPQILLAHRLRDLAPLYAAARVVVLPIFDGAGSAIKASEAIGYGKPVVATTFALRGMDRSLAPLPTFDDWTCFGERIQALLDSPAERLAATRASLALSTATNSVPLYRSKLAKVLGAALGDAALLAADPVLPAAPAVCDGLVEWQPAIGLFHRLARDFTQTGYLKPELARRYRAEPLTGIMLDAATGRLGDAIGAARTTAFMHQLLGRSEGEGELAPGLCLVALAAAKLVSLPDVRPAWTQVPAPVHDVGAEWRPVPAQPGPAMLEQVLTWSMREADLQHPVTALAGLHPPEQLGMSGRYIRWSGPGAVSEFLLRLDRGFDHEIALDILGVADSALFGEASLEIEGKPVPTLRWTREAQRRLVALIPRDGGARLRPTRLLLRLPRTICPRDGDPQNGDARQLGLMLGAIRVRTALSREGDLGPQSFVTGCLEQILASPPRELVHAIYRDLLLRQPDADGYADNLQMLRRGGDGARGLIRTVLGSSEFEQLFDDERLTRLLAERVDQLKEPA